MAKSMPGQPPVLAAEARGLAELQKQNALRIPRIIHQNNTLLLLEYIAPGPPLAQTEFEFGRGLARMHRIKAKTYGFETDNYIGRSPQINRCSTEAVATDWAAFFWENRLEPQLKWAVDARRDRGSFLPLAGPMQHRLASLLQTEDTTPALLHGDLWRGNVLVDGKGQAVLIDPAVSYGHREAEFGMIRLFGCFQEDFYQGYASEWPLEDGFEERVRAYMLYHVLNHLNLFGASYLQQALHLIRQLG